MTKLMRLAAMSAVVAMVGMIASFAMDCWAGAPIWLVHWFAGMFVLYAALAMLLAAWAVLKTLARRG